AVAASGSFEFATRLARGASYDIAVKAQPASPSQACTVTGGSGLVDGDVVTVAISCATRAFRLGGTASGLAGSGLVLQANGADSLAIAADGAFTFATPVASGETFTVTVGAQPTAPWQTCTVGGATGTVGGGDVTSIAIDCTTNRYMVGGTISGLAGS